MSKILEAVARHATTLLFFCIFAGLIFPDLPPLFSPYLGVFVWLVLFLSMVQDDWTGTVRFVKRPGLVIGIGIWLLLVSPGLAWLLGKGLSLDGALLAAAVLWTASPPLMGSPALARFVGLDAPISLGVLLTVTAAAPFVMPVVVLVLLGLDLDVGVGEMLLRLAVFVGSAFLAALLFRRVLGDGGRRRFAPGFDAGLVAALILFALGIVDGLAARFADDPGHVLRILAFVVGLTALLFVSGGLAFLFLGRRFALTVGLSSGLRNMAILLGAVPAAVNAEILLFLAVAQFPIYMAPAMLKPLARRLAAGGDGPASGK